MDQTDRRYGPPRTNIEMDQPAPEGDRYAPEAFAASVGREVTVSAPDGTTAAARLVSATVADDGQAVRLVLDVPRAFADIVAPREDTSSPERCGRCQGTDMAHLGTGYYECRGCGHGWDGPHTDAPADIR